MAEMHEVLTDAMAREVALYRHLGIALPEYTAIYNGFRRLGSSPEKAGNSARKLLYFLAAATKP